MGDGLSKPDDTKTEQGFANSGGIDGMEKWLDQVRVGKPSDTVIIFDWDDTLLCSSAINLQQCNDGQLQQLEQIVENVLRDAMNLGDTLIVTNGNRSWVQDSARRFMPKLLPLLSQLRVMSARAAYEKSYPGEPFAWKNAAFKEILSDREGASHLNPGGMNLIVLGDSYAEIEAAKTASSTLRGPSVVKTVKFKEMPSVSQLLGELRMVTQLLPDLVKEDSSSGKVLMPRCLPQHLGYLTSWASGWSVNEHRTGTSLDCGGVNIMNSQSPLALPLSGVESQSPVTLAGG